MIPVHFTETAKAMIVAKGFDIKALSEWIIQDTKDAMGYEPEDGPFRPENLIIGSTALSRDHDLFSEEGFWAVAGREDGLHVDVGHWETFKPEKGLQDLPGVNGDDIQHLGPRQFEGEDATGIAKMFEQIFGKLTWGNDDRKQ